MLFTIVPFKVVNKSKRITLVQNEELATMWLKILDTTGFLSDLLLNMNKFDWPDYKRLI